MRPVQPQKQHTMGIHHHAGLLIKQLFQHKLFQRYLRRWVDGIYFHTCHDSGGNNDDMYGNPQKCFFNCNSGKSLFHLLILFGGFYQSL